MSPASRNRDFRDKLVIAAWQSINPSEKSYQMLGRTTEISRWKPENFIYQLQNQIEMSLQLKPHHGMAYTDTSKSN